YRAEIKDILTTRDTWFRPSDLCVAPDGSVFVADWNDAGVGGHNMADQKLSQMTGRVYRIAPSATAGKDSSYRVSNESPGKERRSGMRPYLDFQTVEGCAQALQSPNLSARYLAWTKLYEMQAK